MGDDTVPLRASGSGSFMLCKCCTFRSCLGGAMFISYVFICHSYSSMSKVGPAYLPTPIHKLSPPPIIFVGLASLPDRHNLLGKPTTFFLRPGSLCQRSSFQLLPSCFTFCAEETSAGFCANAAHSRFTLRESLLSRSLLSREPH